MLTDVSRGWFVVLVEFFDSAPSPLFPTKTRFGEDNHVNDGDQRDQVWKQARHVVPSSPPIELLLPVKLPIVSVTYCDAVPPMAKGVSLPSHFAMVDGTTQSCFECKKTRKIPPAFQYHGVVTFILVNNLVASWKLNLYIQLRYGHPDIHFLATLNCKFEKLVFWNIFIHNLRIYEVSRVLFQRNIEFLLENERSPRWSWNGLFWSITLDWHP